MDLRLKVYRRSLTSYLDPFTGVTRICRDIRAWGKNGDSNGLTEPSVPVKETAVLLTASLEAAPKGSKDPSNEF